MAAKNYQVIYPITLCLLVGALGSAFTAPSIESWYATLNKPFFSPPNFIFAPVWTTLYILMGISLFLVYQKGLKKKAVRIAVSFFMLQLLLNFLWSVVFFGLHAPLLALIEIILLWFAIFLTILRFNNISKLAAKMLIPYILWVSFATVLNLSIVLLN